MTREEFVNRMRKLKTVDDWLAFEEECYATWTDEDRDEIGAAAMPMTEMCGYIRDYLIKTVEELPPTYWEYPFLYKGMSIDEYEKEREYYGTHIQDVHSGKYKPLWQQRGEIHEKFEG